MPRSSGTFRAGDWWPVASRHRVPVENPATTELLAEVPVAGPADVDAAVQAARDAFPGWAATDRDERAGHLAMLRDGLIARRAELAATITAEMGAPITLAEKIQVGLPITVLESYLDLLAGPARTERIGHSLVLREPVGVAGAITPWNYPLHQSVAKVAAALAAGCTVVHKPSEVAPLSAYLFAEIVQAAGLPAGVYNLVPGPGAPTGEALAGHPDLDLVSFTGSARAGSRVAALAAGNLTRTALELGGKSANLILPDADLAAAVKVGVANCLLNAGQTCTAWSRLLVPADRLAEAVELAVTAAGRYRPGDPTDPATRLGPLASRAQHERVLGYLTTGLGEAELVLDGRTGLPERGYYLGPTIFSRVPAGATIAQQEIFGPVLCVLPYADEDDAVRIANATAYGLAGGVWSADPEHALAVARRLRTGQVDINGAPFNPLAPFGGYRHSGYGRELGEYGLAEFEQIKSVQLS